MSLRKVRSSSVEKSLSLEEQQAKVHETNFNASPSLAFDLCSSTLFCSLQIIDFERQIMEAQFTVCSDVANCWHCFSGKSGCPCASAGAHVWELGCKGVGGPDGYPIFYQKSC